MIGSYPYHLSVMPKRLCESPRTTHLKKTFPFLLASFPIRKTVVPLRCSGFGQTLELCNEHRVITGTLYLLPAAQSVHDNRIGTFGIPINGIRNGTWILHVVTLIIPVKTFPF